MFASKPEERRRQRPAPVTLSSGSLPQRSTAPEFSMFLLYFAGEVSGSPYQVTILQVPSAFLMCEIAGTKQMLVRLFWFSSSSPLRGPSARHVLAHPGCRWQLAFSRKATAQRHESPYVPHRRGGRAAHRPLREGHTASFRVFKASRQPAGFGNSPSRDELAEGVRG